MRCLSGSRRSRARHRWRSAKGPEPSSVPVGEVCRVRGVLAAPRPPAQGRDGVDDHPVEVGRGSSTVRMRLHLSTQVARTSCTTSSAWCSSRRRTRASRTTAAPSRRPATPSSGRPAPAGPRRPARARAVRSPPAAPPVAAPATSPHQPVDHPEEEGRCGAALGALAGRCHGPNDAITSAVRCTVRWIWSRRGSRLGPVGVGTALGQVVQLAARPSTTWSTSTVASARPPLTRARQDVTAGADDLRLPEEPQVPLDAGLVRGHPEHLVLRRAGGVVEVEQPDCRSLGSRAARR